MSKMSGDWADHLSMLATGIATGTRAHYTNDEEHAYYVERPFLFNGIPVDLAERPDLASRTIKLNVPVLPARDRRPRAEMEEEFKRVWPGIFGALLDGLQGAMAGWREINVEDAGFVPARMMDFEQWAEAGCRAMGFAEWEFVAAYAANREGQDGFVSSRVGRAGIDRPAHAVRARLRDIVAAFSGTSAADVQGDSVS